MKLVVCEQLLWASWEVGQGHLQVTEEDRKKVCLQKVTFLYECLSFKKACGFIAVCTLLLTKHNLF